MRPKHFVEKVSFFGPPRVKHVMAVTFVWQGGVYIILASVEWMEG